MRPKGSAKELEVRRRLAGRLLSDGKGINQVARLVGASPSSVHRWKQMMKNGAVALKAKPHPGRPARLSLRQKEKLKKILLAGSVSAGYLTDLWTCPRVAEVIRRTFDVSYHPDHVWHILHSLGYSCQKPERRARERDELAIRRWRSVDWPRIKKNPKTAL